MPFAWIRLDPHLLKPEHIVTGSSLEESRV